MKKIISLLLVFSMLFALCGCSLFEKSYRIGYDIYDTVENLDPQTAYKSSEQLILCNIFDGLFDYNEKGEIVNAVAESYQLSNNNTRYTIKLREDVKWENGDSVTAHDFVFAFKRLIVYSEVAPRYMAIKNAQKVNSGEHNQGSLGVKAVSDFVLQIDLEFEKADFINLLTETYTYPCQEKFFKETKGKYGLNKKAVLSNGAFILNEWVTDSASISYGNVKLSQNDYYYDKENVLPTGVNFYKSTPEESVYRLKEDEINGAMIDVVGYNLLKDSGFNYEPVERITYGVAVNPKEGSAFQNPNIRLALAAAFDRSAAQSAVNDSYQMAYALVPHSVTLPDNSNYRGQTAERLTPFNDKEKAYEHFKIGLSELKIDSVDGVTLLVSEDMPAEVMDYFSSVSQIIQRDLGLFINLETVDEKTYNERVMNNDYTLAILKMESPGQFNRRFYLKICRQGKFSLSNRGGDGDLSKRRKCAEQRRS